MSRSWILCLSLLSLGCYPQLAGAVTVNDLYVATVRVADRGAVAREQAVGEALAVVLTKLSGQRALALRVATSQTETSRLVQRVGYVAGGQLEVGFDPERINSLLDQFGMPYWDRVRPNVLIVFPVALQGLQEVRVITELAARDRGLPILWAGTESSENFASKGLAQIQALGAQYGAGAVLLARLAVTAQGADSPLGTIRWQLLFDGNSQEWNGSPEEGIAFAAEQLSRFYAVSGKQVSSSMLEVTGVNDLQTYGQITNDLSNFLTIKHISVQGLQGDVLRVQLEVRGNQTTLRRLLAVDKRFIELEAAPSQAADRLYYRYNP